ncbi:MAG: GAF domain-containing protein [Omnitrophica WOR_2 bacterium]
MPDGTSPATLVEQLSRLLSSLELSGRSVLIRADQDLLQSIVDAAAQIFGAAAASIALVDEAQETLVFKVAYGAGKENILGVSVPLDQGLAGYVVMTGQPISVRDVRQDARFNQGFASSTGYVPGSILATPLLIGDRVIGVMEVLDKINAPSFGMQDMDLLGVFARQAAIAIHQSQQYDHLAAALVGGLQRLVDGNGSPELSHFLKEAAGKEPGEDLLAIADQFNALSQLGSAELQACLDILQAFERYARTKSLLY